MAAVQGGQKEGGVSLADRLRKLKSRVADARQSELTPEDAKRRKLEVLRKRRAEEKVRQREEEKREQNRSQIERDAEVVLHCIKAGVLDWRAKKLVLAPKPFAEGLHCRSWLLEVPGDGKFVVRDLQDQGHELRQILGLSQDREAAFQAACGRRGLSLLTPHHVSTEGRMIVHRYEPTGTRVSSEFVREKYRTVVELLKKLHKMETGGLTHFFPSNCFTQVEDLVKEVRSRKLPVPGNFDTLFQIVMQWRDLLGQNPVKDQQEYVVCHNELRAASFLHVPSQSPDPREKEGRLLLIGFEGAGLGDRYWELAQLSRLNGFGSEGDALLLKTYFGNYTEKQMAVMKLLQCVGDFRDALWATVAAGILPSHPSAVTDWPGEAVERMKRFESQALDRDFAGYIGSELCG
eukprot:Hpha_TRINITY_DN15556_c1_g6::TRINITY_DN15556_c1_g6_i1::g.106867::m.106867